MKLSYTRAMVDAIHSGALRDVETTEDPIFGVAIPNQVPGVPSEVLSPKSTWSSPADYDATARKLAFLFKDNFTKYEDHCSEATRSAGPRI